MSGLKLRKINTQITGQDRSHIQIENGNVQLQKKIIHLQNISLNMGKHELNPEQKYRKQKKKQVYIIFYCLKVGI